jgi:hypothetical protein
VNTRSALRRVAAQSFPDEDRLQVMVPDAERTRRLHRILDDRRLHPVPDPAPGGRRWGPVLVIGVAVVAVLVAVAVFVLPGPVGERPLVGPADPVPAPTATVAPGPNDVLRQLADLAAAQPAAPPGRFDYVHTLTFGAQEGPESWNERESWVDATRYGRVANGGPADRGDFAVAEGPAIMPAPVALPSDPERLDRYLRDRSQGQSDDPGPFLALRSLWTEQVIEPATQAALLRLVAARPDARVVGPVTDRAGREGIEVRVIEPTLQRGGPSYVLEHGFVFDQETGALLVCDLEVRDPDSASGSAPLSMGYVLLLGSGRVDTVGERP